MRAHRKLFVMCLAVAALALTGGSSPLWAQFTSSMEGTVLDPAGARIPGAAVTVVNTATGIRITAQTNNIGYFLFPSLPSGSFKLTVSAPGFKTAERSDVILELDQRRTVNLSLEVGAQATTVSVQAEAASVDLSSVKLTGTVVNKQILELPIAGQNFLALAALTAGITGSANMGDVFGGETQVNISANGQRGEQNGFSVDSATVTSMVRHGRSNLQPNAESIQEMQVTVNNFSADSGNDAGANINVLTKSGTNAYHGSAAWYHTNNRLQSRNVFQTIPSPLTGRIMAVSRRNEPTGSFGGPIIKNRMFIFSSFDILRQVTGSNNTTTVESPEFSNFVQQNFPQNKSAFLLKKYPAAAIPVRNFRTAGSLVSPVVDCARLASPSALITTPIGSMPCNMNAMGDGLTPVPSERSGYQWNVRLDYQLSGRDRLYFNTYRNAEKSTSGNTTRPAFLYLYPIWNWYGNINETHTFSTNVLNELRMTVTRVHGEIDCRECDIPTSISTGSPGFSSFGKDGPVPFVQNNYEYKDNLSILRGGHSIQMGIVFSFLQSNWKPTASYQRPSFSFQTVWDFVKDNVFSESNIGLNPKDGSVYTPDVAERQHTQAWFIQDTWKVKPNLTLTFGLRWEYYGVVNQATMGNNVEWRGGNDLWSRIAAGANVTKYHILDHGDLNNYAPRLAIAWDPFGKGKTSIRTGAGIFYDFLPSQLYGGAHYTPPLYMLITASTQTAPLLPNYAFGASPKDPFRFPRPLGLEKAIGLDDKNGSTFAKAGITWIDPSLRSSYTPSWYFGIQQVLTPTMSIDVNYVGNGGRKLYAKYNVNRYAGDLIQHNNILTRINPSFGSISYGQSNFTSAYNGLNLTLRQRASHGLLFNLAYTLGHAISMSDSFGAAPTDAWNLKLDRAATGVPQKLAASVIYEIPTLSSAPVYLKPVIRGWQLSGIITATAGGYFSVSCGSTAFSPVKDATGKIVGMTGCDYNADGQTGDRPNAPAFGSKLDLSRENLLINGVFKASDFPTPALGQVGTLGRNTFRGLADKNIDLAIARNFRTPWFGGEKGNLQFRAEAFNAPNRVNLGGISTTLTSSNFGKVTSASGARRFAFSLRLAF